METSVVPVSDPKPVPGNSLMSTFSIEADEAKQLILNFLNQASLLEVAKAEGIGGTLTTRSVSDFGESPRDDGSFTGFMGWLCRRDGEMFFAFEKSNYSVFNIPIEPKNGSLMRTSEVIRYPFEYASIENVEKLIRSPSVVGLDKKIEKKEVTDGLGRLPLDQDGNRYNKYSCGFFETENHTEVEEMLKQETHVRYFFGYDDSLQAYRDSNRIRLILFSADAQGNVILPSASNPDVFVIEQTWPPPPPGNF